MTPETQPSTVDADPSSSLEAGLAAALRTLSVGAIQSGSGLEYPSVTESTPVLDALALLRAENVDKVLVVENGEVLGHFSLRGFTDRMLELAESREGRSVRIDDNLRVDDFLDDNVDFLYHEKIVYDALDLLDDDPFPLVGQTHELCQVLPAGVIVRQLVDFTMPFLLIQEIELGLRKIVRDTVPVESLPSAISASWRKNEPAPATLESLTLQDLVNLLLANQNQHFFETRLASREILKRKLSGLAYIRNKVFHFKGELTLAERRDLRRLRDWISRKLGRGDGFSLV